jgi:hypothetical protein
MALVDTKDSRIGRGAYFTLYDLMKVPGSLSTVEARLGRDG